MTASCGSFTTSRRQDYQTDTLMFHFGGTAQPELFATEGLLIDDVTIATS